MRPIPLQEAVARIPNGATLLTPSRPVDLVVTEMGVISFADGHATLMETAPGGPNSL